MYRFAAIAAAVALGAPATPAHAQQFETIAPAADAPTPAPYLAPNALDFRTLLAAPPSPASPADLRDRAVVLERQGVDAERFQSALLDGLLVYPRFEAVLGAPIDRAAAPALVQLLNRTMIDVSEVAFQAKEHFQRPRPYQRFQLTRVCGVSVAPAPELTPTIGSSYPSGHAAYGWATAMVLARIWPDRAESLLARAAEFAESRVVCGVHFPSDIEAGRVIAAAVVARLDASPDFQADLAAARAEAARIGELTPSLH
ncbi:MAG: phosphatase PAP2 family protein [Terricaulis sp.]